MPPIVLLAQRHSFHQFATQTVLRSLGWNVVHAGDASTAIKLATESIFDLALLDLMLDQGDAYEIARHIRTADTTWRTCIIATAVFRPGEEEQCYAAGMDGIIDLDCSSEDLKRALVKRIAKPVYTIWKREGITAYRLSAMNFQPTLVAPTNTIDFEPAQAEAVASGAPV
jgi:CheY-like chemotaxis protein